MREMALMAWMSRSWSVRVSTDSRAATKPASPKPFRTTADGTQTTHNSAQEQNTHTHTHTHTGGRKQESGVLVDHRTDRYPGATYTLWRVRPPVWPSAGSEVLCAAETEPEPAESRWSPPAQQHLYLDPSRTAHQTLAPVTELYIIYYIYHYGRRWNKKPEGQNEKLSLKIKI